MKNANGAQKRVRKVKKEKKRKRPRVTFNKTPAGGYECPECGKVLKCHNSLYNHKRNVHYFGKSQAEWDKILLSGEVSQKFLEESRKSRLTCDECGIVCSTDYCLYRHKRWKHVGDFKEKFEKDRAEKKRLGIYTHWQTYKKPRDRMAFADFPHKCHMCQLGFMREIALKKHNATQHSGDSAQQS
ncbi:zinc finger protein 626-like [Paramacrobiotus metropolitanus]|uniref:zinc finger protein 626-like n=1 Tax=Paramacrobiotus metropolitanus TaxID=2943436 RepID=UPI0024465C3B|nr:zinc finger protein 626-like [Paramacrobiotus metropolitanus]